ncbi:MAG: hypothetical protein A2017_07505 [Lentisphaerae bacterium GWF2_44_16]|nr:MAG: hypothetical protein A2017_07505 [Lentisphaerae bacterium GWF2_44_16]
MRTEKTIAIIPARGGSKGIPRKNIADLNGKPLIAYTIEQALEAGTIDEVLVNSEDTEIREIAKKFGAETMSRPEELSNDNSMQEVDKLLYWTLNELKKQGREYHIGVLLYPTSPLRKTATIDRAVKMIREELYDSVLSLYEDKTYLWHIDSRQAYPVNYIPEKRGPRQKETWNQYAENKAVYAFRTELLLETGCRLGGKIGYVLMDKLQSIDVDSPDDLALVRNIMKNRES